MPGDTLFDHAQIITTPDQPQREVETDPVPATAPPCKTLRFQAEKDPEKAAFHTCRCSVPGQYGRGLPCAFANWVVAIAFELAKSAPKDRDVKRYVDATQLTPEKPLEFLLSVKTLGPNYDSKTLAFPGFYAFHDTPSDQGVRLLSTLYSKAIDPDEDLGIDHRAGYRGEPGECIVGRYFAAGFKERGPNKADLAYSENHIDIRTLVCRSQEDLETLYMKILGTKLAGAKE